MSLPAELPIFPLPNVVLFPDVRLPLHIFEPRYRQMTEAALAGDRMLGMVLLRPGADAARRDAEIFEVGCCGPIEESRRLPDGRYALILKGQRRFRVGRERDGTPYRVAEADYLPDPGFDTLEPGEQTTLREECDRVAELFVALAEEAEPSALSRLRGYLRSVDPVSFVHAIAFGLDCTTTEKQGLLEAGDPVARCHMLIQLLEFRRAERALPRGPEQLN